MRKISKNELPVTWVYWACVSTFLVLLAIGIWLAITAENSKDRVIGAATSVVFFVIGAGGLLWPILRRHELQAVQTEWIRTDESHCEAVLFPCSRVKQNIITFGSLALAVGASFLVIGAETTEHRVKGALGAVFMFGVFVLALRSSMHGRLGILVMPEGIVWRELMRSPYWIPWDVVDGTGLFMKKERYNPKRVLTFGLIVTDPALVKTTFWSRSKLKESRSKTGWDLYFFAETVLTPLPVVAEFIGYYHRHPESRREIGTSEGLERLRQIEMCAQTIPPQIEGNA